METPAAQEQNLKMAVPFFMVSDLATSIDFYVGKLGFIVDLTWTPKEKIEWCLLHREGVSLMLQESHAHAWNETKKGVGVSICVQCIDALALYKEFKVREVEVKEPFVGNNMWVISLSDPDGYRLDFESPTDVAEGTTYANWNKAKK
jgi:catechol 2,3-dioxygenase-like lactoylglutathione lyase family enzyme